MYEKYLKLLKDKNIKITSQRLEILKYLDNNRKHQSVEEIYNILKEKNPSLSKTTVYNSLQLLVKEGIIKSMSISNSELRYDFDNQNHHHFLCKKCGKIIDVDMKCKKCYVKNYNDLQCPSVAELIKKGYIIDELHGYFKGLCSECKKREDELIE